MKKKKAGAVGAKPEEAAPSRARKALLTPDMQDRIVRSVSVGMHRKQAAMVEGIGERTLQEWMQKGRAGMEPFASLEAAIVQAEARAEAGYLATIVRAVQQANDIKAAMWLLERRFPSRWRQQDLHEMVTQQAHGDKTTEEREEIFKRLIDAVGLLADDPGEE